jgi:peptide/nickel transport system ATP-binding protein
VSLLSVQNLRAYYQTEVYGISRTVRAVDDVSFELFPNEIYGVAGESSCGKTTLIKVISGSIKPPLKPQAGSVNYQFGFGEVDMLKVSPAELRENIRWKEISYVMQGSMSVLNPVRKVIKTFEDIVDSHQPIKDRKAFLAATEAHINRLGLTNDVLNAYPHQLSGGMRQRVAIALATVFQPSLIIADEPTTALDVVVQRGVLQTIKEIQAESGNTVLLVTHDIAVHANVADRLMIMYAGRIAEEAPTENIFAAPLHPYTQHLVSSLPVIGERSTKASLKGAPPNLANPPGGCRFHPRCPFAMDICRSEVPALREVAPRHRVACHLVEDGPQ